jgi:hypothetical protein
MVGDFIYYLMKLLKLFIIKNNGHKRQKPRADNSL